MLCNRPQQATTGQKRKKLCQLFLSRYTTHSKALRGCGFSGGGGGLGFVFVLTYTASWIKHSDFRSLNPSIKLVQMYPVFLCSSPSLLPSHSLFLLPHPRNEASQTWQELLGSSQLLLQTQVVLSRHSPLAGWG